MSQVGANTNHYISHLQGSQSWPLKILLTGFRCKGRHPTHSTSPMDMGMGLCTLSQPTLAPPIKDSSLKTLPPSERLPISTSLSFLLEFCVVPSSEIYILWYLTFCVCGLHSAGCRTIAPLTSGVCPQVGGVGPGACAGFLVGGPVACSLEGRAGFVFLVGKTPSRGVCV